MRVRDANAADLPTLLKLDRQSPSAAHWSALEYEKAMLSSGLSPGFARVLWLLEQGEEDPSNELSSQNSGIAAFLVARQVEKEWEVENLVVSHEIRRQGMGMFLLGEFIAHVRRHSGTAIFLEVRESNLAARALYRKAGFEESGRRICYYSGPQEDAILCRLPL